MMSTVRTPGGQERLGKSSSRSTSHSCGWQSGFDGACSWRPPLSCRPRA